MRLLIDLMSLLGLALVCGGLWLLYGLGVALVAAGVELVGLSLLVARIHGLFDAADSE